MERSSSEQAFLLQTDWKEVRLKELTKPDWTTLYSISRSNNEDVTIYSGLVPNGGINDFLAETSWGISIGGFSPSCTRYYNEDGERIQYWRYGNDEGLEPIVLERTFHGVFEPYIEIAEEFRLFHNLFQARNNTHFKVTDAGDKYEVVRIENNTVTVRTKELRQFLAIKEMHLAIVFEVVRHSREVIETVPEDARATHFYDGLTHYVFNVLKDDISINSANNSFSILRGKRLVPGFLKEKSGFWPYDRGETKQFTEFIIGIDDEGEPTQYSSNPDLLANYFGSNPDAPDYLTPVFFDREVLTKYYAQPEKYSIEDGYLRCGDLWGIRIDNNHPKCVVVYLGDLGRDLPTKEQTYWKHYNTLPDGKISHVDFRRSFLAEFADPSAMDLTFKTNFRTVQDAWQSKYGWSLFLPLSEDDEHLLNMLRIPLTNDQSEFDYQVLALTKIIIDSLNEAELLNHIENPAKDMKGIAKFGEFLRVNQFPEYETHIKFLRDLQSLRSSGVGHRKGRSYLKLIREMGVDEKGLSEVFRDLLVKTVALLMAIQSYFLTPSDEGA